jgi:hypothetical protein
MGKKYRQIEDIGRLGEPKEPIRKMRRGFSDFETRRRLENEKRLQEIRRRAK